jgi:hypothetical protein
MAGWRGLVFSVVCSESSRWCVQRWLLDLGSIWKDEGILNMLFCRSVYLELTGEVNKGMVGRGLRM